ncbi:efflux RND transporter permease subunit [Brevibacterium sp. BRM-1]|uniref:efflux RND transporter permease subunit n=1 Tax=Brevibacterium sp. BRM-1 TaxID=2999062 RepID=UPI00227E061F|nr:efflux RND transporter permease subunit [Brevibacterium sp. BRM-1]WAL39110.1 efflux RND transporter permease subunit [Brevibacterium sp. BRM-1]
MNLLARLSLKNRALIALISLCAVVFGVIAAGSLKQELFPQFELPQAIVTTQYQGASPQSVEREVTDPLEQALNGVQDVESVKSTSSTGSSQITVETKYGTSSDDVVRELQRAVSEVEPQLPDDVTPTVFAGSVDQFPVVVMSVNGADANTDKLAEQLDDVAVPAFKKLDGVRGAAVSGENVKQVNIRVRLDDAEDKGVSVDQIASLLQANGVPTSAGDLKDGDDEAPVEVGKRLSKLDDLKKLTLTGEDGQVRLSSVADVTLANAPVTSISRTNGKASLTLAVTKKPDANTVDVAHAVQDALPDVQAKMGGDTHFTVLFDQAPFIEQSIHDLVTEGLLGLAFAVVIILVFLFSVRATLITAISIPLSLLITLIGLWQGGYSLNMLTLSALTISIGRVVDDSIVVIEAIRRRHALGGSKFGNILAAVGEVAGAITASTLTTIAVFLPLVFVSGQTGELFRPFALTVTIALASSLLVALTIVPVLAYWFLRARESRVRLSRAQKREIRRDRAAGLAQWRAERRAAKKAGRRRRGRGAHSAGSAPLGAAAAGAPGATAAEARAGSAAPTGSHALGVGDPDATQEMPAAVEPNAAAAGPAPAGRTAGMVTGPAPAGMTADGGGAGPHAEDGAQDAAQVDELASLHSPVTRLQRTYTPIIGWTTRHPVITLVAAVVVLVLTFSMTPLLKTELLGDTGQDTLQVQQKFAPGTDIEGASQTAKKVEDVLAADDAVKDYQFSVGGSGFEGGGSSSGGLTGSYILNLHDGARSAEVSEELQRKFDALRGAGDVEVQAGQQSPGGSTIDVTLTANDAKALTTGAEALAKALKGKDGIQQVTDDQEAVQKIIEVDIDHRKAGKKGLTESQIGQYVARAMDGQNIGSVTFDDVSHKVYLFQREAKTVKELKELKIPYTAGGAGAGAAGAGAAGGGTSGSAGGAASGGSAAGAGAAGSGAAGAGAAGAGAAGAVGQAARVPSADGRAGSGAAGTTGAGAAPPAEAGAAPRAETAVLERTSAAVWEPGGSSAVAAMANRSPQPSSSLGGQTQPPGQPEQPAPSQPAPSRQPQQPAPSQQPQAPAHTQQPQLPQAPAQPRVPAQNPGGQDSGAGSAAAEQKTVRLKNVAAVRQVTTAPVIAHSDGQRAATVSVTPAGDNLGAVTKTVQDAVDAADLPQGVTASLGGASQEQQDSFQQLGLAMLAAILIVFVILVATFKSLIQPFILLVSIPFAATGSIGLLVATGTPLGLTAMIGLLMLIGIVVTNAIVLIDLINSFRRRGVELQTAVVQGARLRYRPIIMTALATIFALTPMALGLTGGGVFISKPLAIVVIGGLVTSTLLTLILVPVLYQLIEGAQERRAAKRRIAAQARGRVIDAAEAHAAGAGAESGGVGAGATAPGGAGADTAGAGRADGPDGRP